MSGLNFGEQVTSLERSVHDNQWHVRWILRERGIIIIGPDPKTLMHPIPAEALRTEAVNGLQKLKSHFVAALNQSPGWTEEQETGLLAACESNPLLRTVVSLALNTALRKNEIRTLRWQQIDLLARTLTVGRAKTEGGSGRVIPLNSVACAASVRWANRFPEAKPEDYVFPSCEAAGIEREHPDAERIDPSRPIKSWRSAWRRALKDAGLNIRFHDLRHTCITKLAEGQASEQTLMSIAGHLSRKMLEHYSHIRMAAKRAALDAIVKPGFDAGVAQNWAQSPTVEKSTLLTE